MEIYVLKEGARRGPFLPFKLRELLEDKELQPSDPGWIEGMATWAPLQEIEALSHWIPRDPTLPPPLPSAEDWPAISSPAVPAAGEVTRELAGARRFQAATRGLARTLDSMMWFTLVWTAAVGLGYLGLWDFLLRSWPAVVAGGLLWIPLETALLVLWGTTPGKWLLGIQVLDEFGQKLSWKESLKRSCLVQLTGSAFGLPILSLLPMLQGSMAWVLYNRTGSTLWDQASQSRVFHARPSPTGWVITGIIIALWMGIMFWISLAVPMPVDLPADLRTHFEELRKEMDTIWQGRTPLPGTPAA